MRKTNKYGSGSIRLNRLAINVIPIEFLFSSINESYEYTSTIYQTHLVLMKQWAGEAGRQCNVNYYHIKAAG